MPDEMAKPHFHQFFDFRPLEEKWQNGLVLHFLEVQAFLPSERAEKMAQDGKLPFLYGGTSP